MQNPETWRPTRWIQDERSGEFVVNRRLTYGGSLYLAELQRDAYLPLFKQHLTGSLLDIGCGPVPYYGMYSKQVSEAICVDYPGSIHGLSLLDHQIDLNLTTKLPFPDARFDSVLATDMIAHIQQPYVFMAETARILKPGGKAIITSTFINWMGEFPFEYGHPSGPGLRKMAEASGLEVVCLESYGGHADVFMDTVNKFFPSGFGNRLFLAFAKLVKMTGWPVRNRVRTKDRYAIGNSMVVRKPLV
jgi:SAM-dependent methyltransferase